MITITDVKKVAKLAKLHFSDEEIASFAIELTYIMDAINMLNELDCSDVEPLTSTCDMSARMRKDEVKDGNIADQILANVPSMNGDLAKEIKCFVVPKMVE